MKLIRVTTVPRTMNNFCHGLLGELQKLDGYEVVAVSSPGKNLIELGEREGVRTIPVKMERHISPVKDLKSLWLMWRVMCREKPDMVHSMTPKAGMITMVASWLARVPLRIHTFTGLVFPTSTGIKRRILMATDWLTCTCATHIIPEGEGVKADLLKNHITKKDISVLGYGNIRGIDLEQYSIELFSNNKNKSNFTFVFVGRIVRDKGINELVEAFVRLNKDFPNTRLILVGPEEQQLDPIKPETRTEISNNPAINAVGRQSDVRPFYAEADALVFPSYREGFPNVVIEAGAMGLPSIVTDINGSREIIIEGENGTIIPSRDVEALYQAMRRFIMHPDDVKRMAANARPLVASRYEQSYVRQCLKDFYKQILEEKGLS
ncbi:MAG: glycosyltransferase family 4 protein [Muribaculaceae bacterium]|nr:glycosyltransferase family 4 protein [Muribaculaceae bacterium]